MRLNRNREKKFKSVEVCCECGASAEEDEECQCSSCLRKLCYNCGTELNYCDVVLCEQCYDDISALFKGEDILEYANITKEEIFKLTDDNWILVLDDDGDCDVEVFETIEALRLKLQDNLSNYISEYTGISVFHDKTQYKILFDIKFKRT